MIEATAPIRLLVADDHPVVRARVADVVDAEHDLLLVAQAEHAHAAVEACEIHRPDVVLVDLHLRGMDGIAATLARLREAAPAARLLVLVASSADTRVPRALEAGARGCLPKTLLETDLPRAVRTVHAGQPFVPGHLATALKSHAARHPLSTREIEVLRAVAHNGRNKIAAAEMGLSEGTVKVHMKNIIAKLEANDRVQALTFALRRGILTLDP